jgi:hypothetical protein
MNVSTTQDKAADDSQRVIAQLRQERDAALAREAALAEVSDVINRSPGDLGPVFEAILEKAQGLCGADHGAMSTYDGANVQTIVSRGYSDTAAALVRGPSSPSPAQPTLIAGERYHNIPDVRAVDLDRIRGARAASQKSRACAPFSWSLCARTVWFAASSPRTAWRRIHSRNKTSRCSKASPGRQWLPSRIRGF